MSYTRDPVTDLAKWQIENGPLRATYPFLSVARTLLWVEAELINLMDSLELIA